MKVEPRDQSQPVEYAGSRSSCRRWRRCPTWIRLAAVYLTPMEFGSIGQGTWAVAEGQAESPETASSNPIVNYHAATPGLLQGDAHSAGARPPVHGRRSRRRSARGGDQREHGRRRSSPGRIRSASGSRPRRSTPIAIRTVRGAPSSASSATCATRASTKCSSICTIRRRRRTGGTITSLVVRLKPGQEGQALAVAAAIQTQARQRDPRALVSGISMLEDVVNKELAPWRFSAWVFALFAGLAFVLSMLGLFSLVSLDVANRRQEFAIRMAVGATGGDIVGGVIQVRRRRAPASASRWVSSSRRSRRAACKDCCSASTLADRVDLCVGRGTRARRRAGRRVCAGAPRLANPLACCAIESV